MDKQTLEQKRDEANETFEQLKTQAEQAEASAQDTRTEMLRWQGEWRCLNKLIDHMTATEDTPSPVDMGTSPTPEATKIDVVEDTSATEPTNAE